MPWVRPVTGTSSSSNARALSAATNASRSVSRRSAALVKVAQSAVSTTSEEVSPKWMYEPAGAPMRSWTTSTKAATSWSVTFSRSSTSCTKTSSTVGALARQVAASSAGTTPSAAWASVASSSTSSHMAKRAVSLKSAAMSGGE